MAGFSNNPDKAGGKKLAKDVKRGGIPFAIKVEQHKNALKKEAEV